MTPPTATHAVVVNDQDQQSVWPLAEPLPAGWRRTGFTGAQQDCLDRTGLEWADLRPHAARAAAEADSGPAPLLLRADRIVLREVLPAEAAELKEGRTAGVEWTDGAPFEGTRVAAGMLAGAAEAGLLAPGWGMFLIITPADDRAVGGIGFHGPPSDGVAEIGYDLCESARGHGYATEALRLLTATALARPGVTAVIARTEPENTPSQRVMERAGFLRTPAEDADGYLSYRFRKDN